MKVLKKSVLLRWVTAKTSARGAASTETLLETSSAALSSTPRLQSDLTHGRSRSGTSSKRGTSAGETKNPQHSVVIRRCLHRATEQVRKPVRHRSRRHSRGSHRQVQKLPDVVYDIDKAIASLEPPIVPKTDFDRQHAERWMSEKGSALVWLKNYREEHFGGKQGS